MARTVLVILWLGVTAYALLAGADFGAGFWDLAAGRAVPGARKRALIQRVIGPVWEANHVWLIFVLVVLWTAFPTVFASVASTLYLPMTAAGVGIILRGSTFAFRKAVPDFEFKRILGVGFATSSVITPFFLGAVAGAVASGRVPLGNAKGDIVTSWVNPTSMAGGAVAVIACAFLAAVYLCHDAEASDAPKLSEWFRTRAIVSGLAGGVGGAIALLVLRDDAPELYRGLTHRALPLLVLSAVAGVGSLLLVARRRYVVARGFAGLTVAAAIWAWALAQYPYLLVGAARIEDAAAPDATLTAVVVSLSIGAVLVGPPLVWLLALAQSDRRRPKAEEMLGQ